MSIDVASIDMVSEVNMVSIAHESSFRSEPFVAVFDFLFLTNEK